MIVKLSPVLTLLAALLAEVSTIVEDEVCPPGSIAVTNFEIHYCIFIGSASTWPSARDTCFHNNAVLFSHDTLYTTSGRPLADYLASNGINRTWTGLFVQEGKLVKYVLDQPGVLTGERVFNWDQEQPLDDKHCGSASIHHNPMEGSGFPTNIESPVEVPPETTGGMARRKRGLPTELGEVDILLSMTDCDQELPFICLSSTQPEVSLGNVSVCPADSIGSYDLNSCYTLSDQRASYPDAQEKCRNKGGQLARAGPKFFRRIAIDALMKIMVGSGKEFLPSPIFSNAWVNASKGCNVIDRASSTVAHNWNCNSRLYYLCEIPAIFPGKIDINITATNYEKKNELARPGDFEIYITSRLTASLICNVDGFNPALHQVSWYRNGNVLKFWMYKDINGSFHLNLTTSLLDGNNNDNIAGYYWCEVRTRESVTKSNRVFVREIGKEIYAGTIETQEAKRDMPWTYSVFNLIGETNRVLSTALGSIGAFEETEFPISTVPLRFRENGTYMDFLAVRRVFFSEGFSQEDLLASALQSIRQEFSTDIAMKYFNPDTLQVRSIDFCLALDHKDERSGEHYNIAQTDVGYIYSTAAICGVDKRPIATMACLGDKRYGAYWGKFVLNPACDFSDIEESDVSNSLKNLSQIEVTGDNINEVLESVKEITKDTTLNELDLLYATTILENAVHISNMTKKVADDVYGVYNKILESSDEVLKESQERGIVTNRVLNVMDTVAEKLVEQPNGYQRYVTDTFGTEMWDLTNSAVRDLVIGLEFSESGYQPVLKNESMVSIYGNSKVQYSDTVAAILFPENFIQQLVDDAQGKSIRLSMHVYKDTRLFSISEDSSGEPEQFVLNSKVIAAKILIDGQPVTDMKGNFVTTVFMPNKTIPDAFRGNLSACGYWNFTGNNDTGSWSTDGCRYDRSEEGRDVCLCDHLTNFAVLLDFYGQSTLPTEHALPLSIITIIGLGLSILGLSLTVLSFVTFRKLRQTRPQQTLFNLALAELCSWIVFLAGINQTQDHVGCIIVAAMLHYFILTSFMWMFMEALLHYLMFVKVLGTYFSNYMLKTTIPAWGIPLLPIIVILAVDTNLYRGGDTFCWMSLTPFYYGFALPVGLIILANIIIYIMVVVSLCRRSKATSQSSQSDQNRYLVNIRAAFFCFILLGLSWVFGYLTISNARVAFQYIFTITATIQGFLIFILFTARDKKVRDSWRALCCKRKQAASSSGRGHSDNLPLNKTTSNDSHGSNARTNLTTLSNGSYENGGMQQFDDFRRMR